MTSSIKLLRRKDKKEAKKLSNKIPRQKKQNSTNHETPILSWKYFKIGENKRNKGISCLSYCENTEIQKYIQSFQKFEEFTWEQILQTGGKLGNKVGLGYTRISEKTGLSEFRASNALRVFGVRDGRKFHLHFFDPTHRYCK